MMKKLLLLLSLMFLFGATLNAQDELEPIAIVPKIWISKSGDDYLPDKFFNSYTYKLMQDSSYNKIINISKNNEINNSIDGYKIGDIWIFIWGMNTDEESMAVVYQMFYGGTNGSSILISQHMMLIGQNKIDSMSDKLVDITIKDLDENYGKIFTMLNVWRLTNWLEKKAAGSK